MSVLKNFKNTPRSPYGGRQGSYRPSNGRQDPNVIFLEFAKRSLGRGRGPVGACRAPQGLLGPPTLYKSWPPFPCHLSLKIQKKKRGEEKKSGEALPNSALVIYR